MIDFEAYDKAIADDARKFQPLVKAPLMSWDLHLQHAVNRHRFSEYDLRKITQLSTDNHWNIGTKVARHLANPDVVIVTNPALEIVFASENMVAMNGYHPDEVIGKRPSLFQGPLTEADARKKVSAAISKRKPFSVILTNYYKDGSTYRCEVKGFPVFNTAGELVNFIAFEKAA